MSSPAVPSDEEIIRSLGDDLPIGLWVARAPNGEHVYANRTFAEIMGQGPRGESKAGSYSEPYGIRTRDGKPYPEQRLPFVRALQERRVVMVDDITIQRPDDTHVHVRAFARPVMDAAGAITHVVIAFFDITREVDAELGKAESERRLHRAQRLEAIGTLAGGIAHDFNNLIFGIKLIAAELAAGETDPKRLEALQLVDDITERSAVLTRSLLGFARRGKHRAMPVAIDDVIGAMAGLLQRTMASVTIGIELTAEDRGTVIGDQSQLEQVVMNLVVNARDALRDNSRGRVMLRTRTTGHGGVRHVVLEVADDGPGIPDEIRERVFEPYFTTKNQGAERGTGLGLATVFGIVEAHGGSIEIGPGIDGRGATLRVFLPAATGSAPRPRAPITRPPQPGRGLVMVVDDDEMVRRSVMSALKSLGYKPIEAADGHAAIELYRQHQGDIRAVVLDLVMPTMSGRATFLALREISTDVCVLLMSGHAMNEDVQALVGLGAKGFLSKPYSIDELAQALVDVLPAK